MPYHLLASEGGNEDFATEDVNIVNAQPSVSLVRN